MKLNATTILIVAVAGAALWFYSKKKEAPVETPPPAAGRGPTTGRTPSETEIVLGGTADIIETTGTAVATAMGKIWPD